MDEWEVEQLAEQLMGLDVGLEEPLEVNALHDPVDVDSGSVCLSRHWYGWLVASCQSSSEIIQKIQEILSFQAWILLRKSRLDERCV